MEEYHYPFPAAATYNRIKSLLELPTTLTDIILQQQRTLPRSQHLYQRGDAADVSLWPASALVSPSIATFMYP